MPDYGKAEYWDERYAAEETEKDSAFAEPFDWLFSYLDVDKIIKHLLPKKDIDALLIGCGNAPFSIDMYNDGYVNILNADYSTVVIDQQRRKFPYMRWVIMDALNTKLEDASVPTIVDKSLIDTVLCYKDSQQHTLTFISEMYRVLAHGGRYITFSLHPISEILQHFDKEIYDWTVSVYNVKSSRWDESAENRRKSVSHSMIVCDKTPSPFVTKMLCPPIDEAYLFSNGALTDEQLDELRRLQQENNERFAIAESSVEDLIRCLNRVLKRYAIEQAISATPNA